MHTYRLLLLLFLVTVSGISQAQTNEPNGGHFGLKLGVGFTQISITGNSLNIPHRSLQPLLGGMYRYRYNRWVVQPEALFSIRGGSFQQVQSNGTRSTSNVGYYYASLPLLLGYIPTEGITIQAGPEFSYALNAGSTGGPGANNDVGLVLGAHYDFLDMLNKFSLHVRFVYGLVNVSPESTAAYYNRNLQIAMVYNLARKKKK